MKTIEKVSDSTHEAYDKFANATSQVAETLVEKGQQLKKNEQQLMKSCRGYIGDNPITSVSIAVAAGFLLSRLLNRS
jgi:ElaB/YqjD/DUF883 family membrane-anchored ribosome-binding protein